MVIELDFRMKAIRDQVGAWLVAYLAALPKMPSASTIRRAKTTGRLAVDSWAQRDGVPQAARCGRCKRLFLIVSEAENIATKGTCTLCTPDGSK